VRILRYSLWNKCVPSVYTLATGWTQLVLFLPFIYLTARCTHCTSLHSDTRCRYACKGRSVCAGLYVEPAAGSAGPVEPSPAALAAARAASHAEASTSDAAHLTDLSYPASWYPAARGLERTIVAHVGPTNSGKTHTALKALAAAGSGVYCGPLRLLASEARAPICRSVFVSLEQAVFSVATSCAWCGSCQARAQLKAVQRAADFPLTCVTARFSGRRLQRLSSATPAALHACAHGSDCASQVYEKLNAGGVACNLLTGASGRSAGALTSAGTALQLAELRSWQSSADASGLFEGVCADDVLLM